MNTCPCCSDQMLRHVRHEGVYWFCGHCHQEMPDLAHLLTSYRHVEQQLQRLTTNLSLVSR